MQLHSTHGMHTLAIRTDPVEPRLVVSCRIMRSEHRGKVMLTKTSVTNIQQHGSWRAHTGNLGPAHAINLERSSRPYRDIFRVSRLISSLDTQRLRSFPLSIFDAPCWTSSTMIPPLGIRKAQASPPNGSSVSCWTMASFQHRMCLQPRPGM